MKMMRTSAYIICVLFCVAAVCLSFGGCKRMVRGPRDELVMFNWSGTFENGNTVSLSFDGDRAELCADISGESVTVSGVYLIDDESLVICDTDTRMNYLFTYIVNGDSAELTCGDGSLKLEKQGAQNTDAAAPD